MYSTIELIEQYGRDYLICDGNHPLISNGASRDEFQIYNIAPGRYSEIMQEFSTLTGKPIDLSHSLNALSGGQKTLLMVLTALASNAPKIIFTNVLPHLDTSNREYVTRAWAECSAKEILFL